MSSLDRIIDITITRQTTVPSLPGFDIILIAAEFLEADATPTFTERVRAYTGGATTILTDLATQFTAGSNVYKCASALLSQNPSISDLYVGRKLTGVDGSETWDAALAAMNTENSNWYGLIPITRTLAEQQTIATWVEANKKLCGLSSGDANFVDATGDIAESLDTNNQERSFAIYHPGSDLTATEKWPAAAWMGKVFPFTPGASTWKFKTLANVSAYGLTGTQTTKALEKNGNIYTTVAGVDMTEEGTVGTGEFIDVIRGVDKLGVDIQGNVFTLLVNTQKVPFTNEGIQQIVSEVRAGIQTSVDSGFLAADYTVTAPDVADVSTTDKGNRILPDVNFTATLAGAIHKVTINGVVSL